MKADPQTGRSLERRPLRQVCGVPMTAARRKARRQGNSGYFGASLAASAGCAKPAGTKIGAVSRARRLGRFGSGAPRLSVSAGNSTTRQLDCGGERLVSVTGTCGQHGDRCPRVLSDARLGRRCLTAGAFVTPRPAPGGQEFRLAGGAGGHQGSCRRPRHRLLQSARRRAGFPARSSFWPRAHP